MKKILKIVVLILPLSLPCQNQAYLDANGVKALILNRNDMFWDANTAQPAYEVPKGSGKHCNFVNSVWLGGIDAGGQLKIGAMTYRQYGFDFFPGPLDTVSGLTTQSVSTAFDKVWKINRADIDAFKAAWSNGSVANNTYTVPATIVGWPGNGNSSAGYAKQLAPYVDVNNNGIYNPVTDGDYPLIKGDQMVYYICNDRQGLHTETGGVPLGVELHVSAYSYSCASTLAVSPVLNNATFHHYKLINRSGFIYHDMFMSVFCDGDIGSSADDYIGCDTINRIAFMYNSSGYDAVYKNYPPVLSYQVLRGPDADPGDGLDNDGDGMTDEQGEQCRFNRFMFYNNNLGPFIPATTNPQIAVHYYNYMKSVWKDGRDLQSDSMGYLAPTNTTPFTHYAYPGNIQGNNGWTEFTRNNTPSDRRFLLSNGPFTLGAGETVELEFSILTTFDSTSGGYKNISKVISQNASLKSFFELSQKPNCSVTNTTVTSIENISESEEGFVIIPNPAGDEVRIIRESQHGSSKLRIFNCLGAEVMNLTMNEVISVNLSSLPAGVYYVVLQGDHKSVVKKLVKN